MRLDEFGKTASEFASFSKVQIVGKSILVDGHSTNLTETSYSSTSDVAVKNNAATSGASNHKLITSVALPPLRARVGHEPVILLAEWVWRRNTAALDDASYDTIIKAHRMISPGGVAVDFASADYHYRATGVPWTGGSSYSPYPGIDFVATACSQLAFSGSIYPANSEMSFDITDELQAALREGRNLDLIWYAADAGGYNILFKWNVEGYRPFLRTRYLRKLELVRLGADGHGDPGDLLSQGDGDTSNSIYLGAGELGEALGEVGFATRNHGAEARPHAEVLDDHPEQSAPRVSTANSGSGVLAYVNWVSGAVTQQYVIHFFTATDYEVKALAWRENPTSLHPSIDSNVAWQGDTSTDFTAPIGGLKIPAAGWSGSPQAGDEFTVEVLGDSTPSYWPSDGADMILMTEDAGGSPDPTYWRGIRAARGVIGVSVTIDAATKSITLRDPIPASFPGWATGRRVTIVQGSNRHVGTISSVLDSFTVSVENLDPVDSTTYTAGARITTALAFADLQPAAWGQTTDEAGASQTSPKRIPVASPSSIAAVGQDVMIVDLVDRTKRERGTVQGSGANYLELDIELENDYLPLSPVFCIGSGEQLGWLKAVIASDTDEEQKLARLTTRT